VSCSVDATFTLKTKHSLLCLPPTRPDPGRKKKELLAIAKRTAEMNWEAVKRRQSVR